MSLQFKYYNNMKPLYYSKNNNIIILNKLKNNNNIIKLIVSRDGKSYLHTITLSDMIKESELDLNKMRCITLKSNITEPIIIPKYVHNWNKDINPSDLTDTIAMKLGLEIIYNSLLSYNNGIIKYIEDKILKTILIDYFFNVNIIKYIGRQYYLLNSNHISNIDIKDYYMYDTAMILVFILCGFNITTFGNYTATLVLNKQQKDSILLALSKHSNKELYKTINSFLTIEPNISANAKKIIEHQTQRLGELRDFLASDPNIIVRFPMLDGSTYDANKQLGIILLSNLGAGAAKDTWGKDDYKAIMTNLNNMIQQLSHDYMKQVIFGPIYPHGGGEPSAKNYHVWGANSLNWDLPKGKLISGSGHASSIGEQRPGVFGIITTSW
jgi:hypothetical protein